MMVGADQPGGDALSGRVFDIGHQMNLGEDSAVESAPGQPVPTHGRSSLKPSRIASDISEVTSPDEPFGPPPTRPPMLGEPLSAPIAAPRRRDHVMPTLGRRRLGIIWAGALATVTLSGVTGLVLDSRWSYVALGAAFVSLLVVVLGVSLPSSAETPHHPPQDQVSLM